MPIIEKNEKSPKTLEMRVCVSVSNCAQMERVGALLMNQLRRGGKKSDKALPFVIGLSGSVGAGTAVEGCVVRVVVHGVVCT